MSRIDWLADDYYAESGADYVGLWEIAQDMREDASLTDQSQRIAATLAVVGRLMARGVWPGDYTQAGFAFWPLDAAAAEARIRREWAALGHDPDLAEPICWLARR